jgi:hypothetical protein
MLKRFTPALLAVLVLGIFSAAARAETAGPVWKILSVSNPTNFKPGDESGDDAIVVTATNVGGSAAGCTEAQIALEKGEEEKKQKLANSAGCTPGGPVTSPIKIADSLPAGVTAVEVFGVNSYHNPLGQAGKGTHNGEVQGPPFGLRCTLSPSAPSCVTSERIDPGDTLVVTIRVSVETSVEGEGEVGEASVSGGGAASASVSDPIAISAALPPYGVAKGGLFAATSTSQAGGHPNVTNNFFLNTINPNGEREIREPSCVSNGGAGGCAAESEPAAVPKDVGFDLPPGLVGTTVGVPRCTMANVVDSANCPQNTMVGTATLMVRSAGAGRLIFTVPVFNIAPAPGEPAAFAFNALFFPVRLDTSVLSGGEYNVRVNAPDITSGGLDYMSSITIWGDPAEHNGPGPDAAARTLGGKGYLGRGGRPQITFGGAGVEKYDEGSSREESVLQQRLPLLTNPSQCSTPLTGVLETDSWEAPGAFAGPGTLATPMGAATGCGQLSFKPSVSMLPDTLEAGAPAGYSFDLSLPQDTEAEGLATPDVKRTSVTLPLGTVISPSAADGLGDCTSEQFDLHSGVPGGCPRDSQVGTVRSKTPALEEALTGDIYLASPECTGPGGVCTPGDAADGHMVRLFLQLVGEGESGIVVKQELTGQINQQTGQLTVTDDEVPQVPFSDLKLTLQGGERATLANPRSCGTETTTADLTPWSTPFTPDGTPESTFDIDENCFGPQFNPSFSAGTTSNQAGGFSPFTLSFGRGDADEFLNGAQITMPPGLLGLISKVKLCEEPQANAGTCGPESQIGEVTVETGPGADPFLVKGGKVYITGPYRGAPYGLSIVVPAKAGPYTLSGTTGNGTVVNRSSISVNPTTSELTVTSDPLPTELDGIPLQLRLVNVTVGTNDDFTFNPTSCNKMEVGAGLTSTEAARATESSSFQVTNCAALKFQPKFTVSTSGRTSRIGGASLDAKVSYPAGTQGFEANIARVKVELPKQLPSRLTTLQKACTAQTFDANPASCPAASVIGTVRVSTAVLPVELTGPVYFVSNGGEAFPNLVIVLQGDGVRVDLVGDTFISKAGVTSTTFKTVPDVPFNSFELYLPEGSASALAALGNLCTSRLVMPTELVAQNGAAIHQSTKIAVTDCPAAKAARRKAKGAKQASRHRKSSHGTGRKS